MTPSLPSPLTAATASAASVSRREVLAAVGGAAGVATVSRARGAERPVGDAALHVRVYPTSIPLRVRLQAGVAGLRGDWTTPHQEALEAVDGALEQVLEYARERSRLEDAEVHVERGAPVSLPLSTVQRPSGVVVPSLETVLDGFQERLRERDALTGSTCHLLACWAPLNYRVGYGGTLSPNARVGIETGGTSGDALTVANLGATELWDSRAVTANMAIHETLHTFVSSDVAESVVGSGCNHHLGTAVRTDEETLRISPMASAYAGRAEFGAGTRFHGTGCADHDQFARHDGLEGVENWEYTTTLSDATCEAVTRHLERTGLSSGHDGGATEHDGRSSE